MRFEVKDVRAGLYALGSVPVEQQRKVFRKALRTGARVIVRGMKAALRKHDRTGTLRASIKTRTRYYAKGDVMVVVIGVASAARGTLRGHSIVPYKYSHFVTNPRRAFRQYVPLHLSRTGYRDIGANTPDDYVASAVAGGRNEVIAAMQRVVYDAL